MDAPTRGFFDRASNAWLVAVSAGHCEVSNNPSEMLTTTLGSCVSVCLFDRKSGSGGMNHIMLPGESGHSDHDRQTRSSLFGDHLMEVLINKLLRIGARKSEMEAKVFGGANVIRSHEACQVGNKNCSFVFEFLSIEKIPVVAQDTGGQCARRIMFQPTSGKVLVNTMEMSASQKLASIEMDHRSALSRPSTKASIEVFR